MTALAVTLSPMATEFVAVDPLRALAIAARDGEGVAFTQLYERTRELAFRVLYRVVGPSSELEDLVQESYLQLMRALKGYRGDSKVTTFLHRICVNVGLMHLRSKGRKAEQVADDDEMPEMFAPETQDPERVAQVRQAEQLVRRILATMSDEKASVFVFHDLLGLRPEEISEVAGCPVNTVRSRLNRARVDFTAAAKQLKVGPP